MTGEWFGVIPSTESYSDLMERLRELDGTVLSERETQLLRDAADARLFGDADHFNSEDAALVMLDTLVEAARLSSRTRTALADLLGEIESVGAGSS